MPHFLDRRSLSRRSALRTLLGGTVGVAALAALACTPKTEVTVAGPAQQTGIAVTGTATVSVKPDVARLSLGIEVTDPTVAGARSRAATAMDRVQAALKQKGVQDKDIRTQSLNINPQYNVPERGGKPTITGYMVNNHVQVTVRNIDSASDVLDAAVVAGGDAMRVDGISFAVDKPDEFMAQARDEAVKNARARAEVLAKAAGVTLGTARSITESTSGQPFPYPERSAASANAGGDMTPINPGEQELRLTVSVVYDIDSAT